MGVPVDWTGSLGDWREAKPQCKNKKKNNKRPECTRTEGQYQKLNIHMIRAAVAEKKRTE
jgi:hypothetical protein